MQASQSEACKTAARKEKESQATNRAILSVMAATVCAGITNTAFYRVFSTPQLSRGWVIGLLSLGVWFALLAMVSAAAFVMYLHVLTHHLPAKSEQE